ncbi:hypothetical protein I4U23_013025 [Adineta vaga]|nr:hypothetical protein I4U23_013025 [Adineta vaga]
MEILFGEFREEYGGVMQELDYYAFYIKIEKENVRICDAFVEKVVAFMSYNLFDNKNQRNLIKRCPFCDIIWFKTEGCDGTTTTCGDNHFVEEVKDYKRKVFLKYLIERIDGKLRCTKNKKYVDNARKHHTNGSVSSKTKSSHRQKSSKRMGCEQSFQ